MAKEVIPLSLCMIVKNEEAVLARCLKSVRSLVGEIIVVDTGSTDATVQTAREFGAQTFDFPWQDDFAEARNFALERASGEWILVLDADEVMVYGSEKDFMNLLQDPEAQGYYVKIVNLLGAPPDLETSEDLVVRLFRNKPEYRFEGSIHEQVRPSIVRHAGEKSLKRAPLTVYHDGYLAEVIKKKNKIARNSAVIGKALAKNPDDPFLLYSLGSEHFLSGDYAGALELYRRALGHIPAGEGYLSDLLIKMGLCLFRLGRSGEIRDLTARYQEISPLSPELLFLSGLSHLEAGRLTEAERDIKDCLDRLPVNPAQPPAIRQHQVFQLLGEIHEAKEAWDQALRFYFLALTHRPNFLYPLIRMLDIFRKGFIRRPLSPFLAFAPPEKKMALLENLFRKPDADLIIFFVLSLVNDIASGKAGQTSILKQNLLSLLTEKAGQVDNPRLTAALLLAKAALSLVDCQRQAPANTAADPARIAARLEEILLSPDPPL